MVFPPVETRIYIGSGERGRDFHSTSDNSEVFTALALGGLGVGVYGTSDNRAKFEEFAAFGGRGWE